MQYRCNSPRPKLDVAKNLCIMTYMHYDDMRYENVDCSYDAPRIAAAAPRAAVALKRTMQTR
jgi:hypothetical protein